MQQSRQQVVMNPVTDLSGKNEYKTTAVQMGDTKQTQMSAILIFLNQVLMLKENCPMTKAVAGIMRPAQDHVLMGGLVWTNRNLVVQHDPSNPAFI